MARSQSSAEDDEAWAAEQGVPSLDEAFLQKYLDGRDALVAQEKRQRSDHSFRETLSPMAAEASAIVSAIRFEEQQTLWNADFEDNLAKQEDFHVHPGMMFSLAKERMESSKLWRIVKKMPKGTLLHCHLGALVDLGWLINQAFEIEGICLHADAPLNTPEARENVNFGFKFLKHPKTEGVASIWSDDYKPKEDIPLNTAADSFPGGRQAFVKWFQSRTSITHEESLRHHLGPRDIWRKFISCFNILGSLQHYEPIFRKFMREMLRQLLQDGVRWVEIRSVFTIPFYKTGSETPEPDFSSMLAAMQEEIDAFTDSEEGQGFWGARLIWTTVRHFDKRRVIEDMKACIALKQQFPDLISGYDLVGQEDLGRPLADLTPELFWFKKRCMEEGLNIPFFFHAGETLGDGDQTDENLFDAILLGTRRIGHGFSLYKHPLLIEMVKEKKILIESCPVSNEILRYTGSIMQHPLPALLSRGVACSLSNDDPALLGQGNSGMTHDFWQTLQGWENLGLEGLASLAENSVRWACFEDCDAKEWQQEVKEGAFGKGFKAERMQGWAKEFEKFCQWVVLEFGAESDINTLD
jgi:adenosine deaminase CECR1